MPRLITNGMRRLLRIAGEQAAGLERLDRATLRRDRRCVGCEESDGARLEPVLGWVCVHCDEVLDLVFEKETEETREACRALERFLAGPL